MIVTLDGPAGAGKSTVAKLLAKRLGFRFLDTGAMYRAVALSAVQHDLDWHDPEALAELARQAEITFQNNRVYLDGRDVTDEIRTSAITAVTFYAANNPGVRTHLAKLQRQQAGEDHLVTEGRDQGTVVFPDAECKFFITASPEERARRRMRELSARGEHVSFDDLLAQQNRRDESDASREVGPLRSAPDAVEIVTDGLTEEQVVDRLESIVRQKMDRGKGKID